MDLGTGDELGIDILINMLKGVSRDHIGIKQLCIGGQNEDWTVPDEFAPQVRISPLHASRSPDSLLLAAAQKLPQLVCSLPHLVRHLQRSSPCYPVEHLPRMLTVPYNSTTPLLTCR